jgi:hypothetical protein
VPRHQFEPMDLEQATDEPVLKLFEDEGVLRIVEIEVVGFNEAQIAILVRDREILL